MCTWWEGGNVYDLFELTAGWYQQIGWAGTPEEWAQEVKRLFLAAYSEIPELPVLDQSW